MPNMCLSAGCTGSRRNALFMSILATKVPWPSWIMPLMASSIDTYLREHKCFNIPSFTLWSLGWDRSTMSLQSDWCVLEAQRPEGKGLQFYLARYNSVDRWSETTSGWSRTPFKLCLAEFNDEGCFMKPMWNPSWIPSSVNSTSCLLGWLLIIEYHTGAQSGVCTRLAVMGTWEGRPLL